VLSLDAPRAPHPCDERERQTDAEWLGAKPVPERVDGRGERLREIDDGHDAESVQRRAPRRQALPRVE